MSVCWLASCLVDLRRRSVDLLGEGGDLLLEFDLIGVHQRHAAGQHHAQTVAQLVAHHGEALGLRRLPLQAVHLPRDFFKDVVHARQILLGAFQAQLGQPLLVLEARDPRRLFDDGPPVVRLGAEQLPDPLLPDDGVAFRPQARAHEDVLNVAQPAELAVQQVLALAGAEEPPRNHDLAFLRRALELAAANLQHHGLRTLARGECLRLARSLRVLIPMRRPHRRTWPGCSLAMISSASLARWRRTSSSSQSAGLVVLDVTPAARRDIGPS